MHHVCTGEKKIEYIEQVKVAGVLTVSRGLDECTSALFPLTSRG